ncbi:MAG: hypothetical protein ACFFCE_01015 [Promethearchaeota archaeon]
MKEIKGLENLKKLELLDLHKNEITEIKGLDNLEKLKWLDLSHNQIIEFKGLDKLNNLIWLFLEPKLLKSTEFEEHPVYDYKTGKKL